ncbi:MAG: hypothetical protein KKE86_07775, partial [Planctomycetes bacterium]|nr:hypothetical protein [Planctomycetota bacterium]
ANDAVNLANNTDSTITFNGVTIETTGGQGFAATGGGTVVFAAGTTNTISTTTGIGLHLDGVTIGNDGMSFESISVNGAANGILLADVTGGTIGVGASGAAAGDGGTLANTTGHAVSATNVADLWLNYMTISGAGGDAVHVVHNDDNASWVTINQTNLSGFAGQGVELAATGAGQMTFDLTTNTFSGSTGEESILLNIDDSAKTVLMTIADNTVNNGAGYSALALNVAGTGSSNAKTVTTLIDGNTFTNDSATAATADISNTAWGALNATVTDNTLNNADAGGTECRIVSNAATATVFLNLNGNIAGSGGGTYDLTNTAGTFKVYNLADVGTNNSGTVNQTGSLTNSTTAPPTP